MKVLRYIYFQKNQETLEPVTSLLHLSNLIYGWIKKKKHSWGSQKTQCSIN